MFSTEGDSEYYLFIPLYLLFILVYFCSGMGSEVYRKILKMVQVSDIFMGLRVKVRVYGQPEYDMKL